MTQDDLVTKVAEATGKTKKDVKETLAAITTEIATAMASGDQILLPGLGRFTSKFRKARTGSNPSTREEVKIPAKFAPQMNFTQSVKDEVAKIPVDGVEK